MGYFRGGWNSAAVRSLQLDDAAAEGDGDRLRAVAGAELLHDVLDVNLHGLLGDEELFGDVAVTVPARDQPENVQLALGQRLIPQVLGDVGRYIRGDPLPPSMDLADGLD